MNFKYGKFVAFGLLLLTIAGCSKERPTITQDELDQNKETQKRMQQDVPR